MGLKDKAKNTAQNLAGKAKKTTGEATGDKNLKDQGKTDQGKSSLKDAGENVKDAFKGE
jgi:uncharacterized protein YjbJ (UPF0337 family)